MGVLLDTWRVFAMALTAAIVLGLVPKSALAESALEEGRRYYEEADLERAHQALSRAEASSELTLDELGRLYELRALLHRADGDELSTTEALRRLAFVQPEHAFGVGVPPELVLEFNEIRSSMSGGIELVTSVEATPTGVAIRAEATGDALSLVREVRIYGSNGSQSWQNVPDAPLEIAAVEGRIEYYAEAIGPGGVVLRRTSVAEHLLSTTPAEEPPSESGRRRGLWIGLGIGAGALVTAAIVVLAVTLGGGGEQVYQPTFPTMVED